MFIIRYFKKLLDRRKCKLFIALVSFPDRIDVSVSLDKVDGKEITEKTLRELFNADDVKIIKSCIVPRKFAFKMVESLGIENIYDDLISKATSAIA